MEDRRYIFEFFKNSPVDVHLYLDFVLTYEKYLLYINKYYNGRIFSEHLKKHLIKRYGISDYEYNRDIKAMFELKLIDIISQYNYNIIVLKKNALLCLRSKSLLVRKPDNRKMMRSALIGEYLNSPTTVIGKSSNTFDKTQRAVCLEPYFRNTKDVYISFDKDKVIRIVLLDLKKRTCSDFVKEVNSIMLLPSLRSYKVEIEVLTYTEDREEMFNRYILLEDIVSWENALSIKVIRYDVLKYWRNNEPLL